MQFKTESNSIYQVDLESKRIRRLSGTSAPTIRQGIDGNWKTYKEFFYPIVGKPAVIVWDIVPIHDDENHILKSTVTSPVVEISDVESDTIFVGV